MTEEIKAKFLSNKRTLLSVPGNVKTDAYYTTQESTVYLTELTANLGRYTSSLTTSQFGGVGQVIIPNNDLLSETYLHLRVPARSGAPLNQSYCPGWGWTAIKSISYLWGASNVSQITISGKSLWAITLAQCDTAEKRSQLCYLGGSPAPLVSDESQLANNPEAVDFDCYIPLALPWSVMCHEGKLGFDTSLINSPITIQVTFAPRDEFMVWHSTVTSAELPNEFEVAEIVVRQQMFSDKSQSLKFDMMNDPALVYNYPFKHYQSFQKDFTSTANTTSRIQLTNFINSDLVGMVLYAVKKEKLRGGSSANANVPTLDPLDIELPKDVKLFFNGQILYNSPGRLYLLQNCAGLSGSGSYSVANITWAASDASVIRYGDISPIIRDMVFIDFSRKHSPCFEKEFENVFRIANQTLDVEMTLAGSGEYTLFATYIYNAVNAVQNGASNLYFD